MSEWIKTYEQVPPLNEEVELKFIAENGEERITVDRLIPMCNGTYIWNYGDYSSCEVVAWKKKQDESFLKVEQQALNFRDGLTDSFGRY